jgi:MTH538 TIR-like domain (DUF1863)
MAKKVFFSFHYAPDSSRASQVRNMGVIEGNQPVKDNDWESVKKGGDGAIETWINSQLSGRSCIVVLIGSNTAGRKWIDYEIKKAWEQKKGIVGIYIHNLKDLNGDQSTKGASPFSNFNITGTRFDTIVKSYDPPYSTSTLAYDHIKQNISAWVDEAITIRAKY